MFSESAEGTPITNISNVERITALFLFHPKQSINDETGTSRREIAEVNAAIKVREKSKRLSICYPYHLLPQKEKDRRNKLARQRWSSSN